jgi:hypothetical protein
MLTRLVPTMVADCQTRAALPHGVDAYSQLGQTRPERDDGKADHDRPHADV